MDEQIEEMEERGIGAADKIIDVVTVVAAGIEGESPRRFGRGEARKPVAAQMLLA